MGLPSITEIRSFTRVISAAELLAFAGGAIEVVPAPGGGKVILPISFMLLYNFNTVDFSSNPQLDLRFHGTAQSLIPGTPPTLVGAGSSHVVLTNGILQVGVDEAVAPYLNQGVDLVNFGGSFALAGIGAATITAPGSGYAPGDTGTVTTGGANATYVIDTIGAAGAVTGFHITSPGFGYATGAGQGTATGGAQPGIGTLFTIDVTALVNGNGTIKVTTLFQVIDVP